MSENNLDKLQTDLSNIQSAISNLSMLAPTVATPDTVKNAHSTRVATSCDSTHDINTLGDCLTEESASERLASVGGIMYGFSELFKDLSRRCGYKAPEPQHQPTDRTSAIDGMKLRIHPCLTDEADLVDPTRCPGGGTNYFVKKPLFGCPFTLVGAKTAEEESRATVFAKDFASEVNSLWARRGPLEISSEYKQEEAGRLLYNLTTDNLWDYKKLANKTLPEMRTRYDTKDIDIEFVDQKTLEACRGNADKATFYNDQVPVAIDEYLSKVQAKWTGPGTIMTGFARCGPHTVVTIR